MSGVLYYDSGWLSADILQAVGCKERNVVICLCNAQRLTSTRKV